MDLRTVALLEGSLSTESTDDKIIVSTLKNIGLNVTVLLNEYLHALQIGVIAELRAREKHALSLISEYRVNNEQMFAEKTKALKERDKIKEQNTELATVVAEACRIVSMLHISEEVQLEAKI